MSNLLHAFLALPNWEAILLIVAGVAWHGVFAWFLITISFRRGDERGELRTQLRHERVTRQRHELSSIQL